MPRVEDILSGKVTTLDTKEISAMYSLATSINYELSDMWKKLGKTKEEDKWHEAADNSLAFMMDCFEKEISIMGLRSALQQFNLPFTPKKLRNFSRFQKDYGKIIIQSSQS